jgi:hypothetical protein
MIRIVMVWLCCVLGTLHAVDVFYDAFHGLKGRFVLQAEHHWDVQESFLVGVSAISDSVNTVSYDLTAWEGSYRRYVLKTTHKGVFYSFGCRLGPMKLQQPDVGNENTYLVMPFYNIGIKAQFNKKWYHSMQLEVGYIIAYTDEVDIDALLGVQVTPKFSFGYNLD